jgi:hypothetical protein
VLGAGAVDGVPRREVVGAVEDDVGLRGQLVEPVRVHALGDGRDLHVRIDGAQGAARGEHLLRADRLGAIEDLALQVGQVDLVGVGQDQPADAGGGEVKRSRAAQAARADDEDGSGAQLLLALYPDLGKKDVPGVAEKLLIVD